MPDHRKIIEEATEENVRVSEHKCRPPLIAHGTAYIQPDWTCGLCQRIWREVITPSGIRWWSEVRGPTTEDVESEAG